MNTLIGLIIIAMGSFGQSSSYVPINRVREWPWESFRLTQGIILKEWKGVSTQTVAVLLTGLAILIFSSVFPNFFK